LETGSNDRKPKTNAGSLQALFCWAHVFWLRQPDPAREKDHDMRLVRGSTGLWWRPIALTLIAVGHFYTEPPLRRTVWWQNSQQL